MTNDNHLQMHGSLDRIESGQRAYVTAIDKESFGASELHRLQSMGLFCGEEVEVLHRGTLFARDLMVIQLGRAQLIIRAQQARAIAVAPIEAALETAEDIASAETAA